MSHRILVMGATGTVGREVVHSLRTEHAFDVIPAQRSVPAPGAVERRLDLHDTASLDEALKGVDGLFFMTPLVGEQVRLSLRLLDRALDAGVRHVVRLSSRSAGWDFSSELRAWHRAIDADVAARVPLYTILRPCSFMQNFLTHQGARIRAKGQISYPLGDAAIPYIDVRDIGDVALAAFRDPARFHGQSWVLTGPTALTVAEVAEAFASVRGAPVTYQPVEPDASRRSMERLGMPPWLVESALRVHAHARAGGEAGTTDAVERILGRAPRSIEAFARDHADALRPAGA